MSITSIYIVFLANMMCTLVSLVDFHKYQWALMLHCNHNSLYIFHVKFWILVTVFILRISFPNLNFFYFSWNISQDFQSFSFCSVSSVLRYYHHCILNYWHQEGIRLQEFCLHCIVFFYYAYHIAFYHGSINSKLNYFSLDVSLKYCCGLSHNK